MNKSEYEELKKTLDHHMDLYYNQNTSEISDEEYDGLMRRLKEAEREHPDWVSIDSPSQKIGGSAKREAGVKVTHNVPMLSIEDVFTMEEVESWVRKVKELHPDALFCVEQKIDGLSMTLRYENGALSLAETRGDGRIGEDVTANARVIPDVLRNLSLGEPYLELRGEVYMSHERFEAFNEEQERLGKKPAANPRNLAAGTLRQLDAKVTRERGLHMLVFNVQDGPAELMESHSAALERLAGAGVPVVWHRKCASFAEIREAIEAIASLRYELAYDIDGAVVKIDQVAYRADFPAGSKYSAGHIAYKYPPEEKEVLLEEIEVSVGRTGRFGFIGHVCDAKTHAPARLCGTSVSRVTLHNQDYIEEKHLGIGGIYRLKKSGDIIPKISGLVKEPEEIYHVPMICPVCHEKAVREEDTADIRCVNPSCPAQLTRTISYFTSLNCMNIMGLGETLVEALVREGYLSDYADIYELKNVREELIGKGILGKEKNTDKLLSAIEASKENEPERLLAALGIRSVGRATAREILKHYDSLTELLSADEESLVAIPDVGPATARSICEFFENARNRSVFDRLVRAGLKMDVSRTEGGSALAGLTVVITGTLPTLSRNEAKALVEANGGRCTGSVSKKTSFLLAGEAPGSKLEKANALGVSVIGEEAFLKLIGGR